MNSIEVNLNNNSYVGFIEEQPSKEFLESNLESEGPIIEFDERVTIKNIKSLDEIKKIILNKQVKKFDNIHGKTYENIFK